MSHPWLARSEPAAPAEAACPHCKKADPTKPEPAKSKHDCPLCEKRKADTTYVEAKPAPLPAAPVFLAWLPFDTSLTAQPVESPTMPGLPLPDPRTYFLDSCHRLRC